MKKKILSIISIISMLLIWQVIACIVGNQQIVPSITDLIKTLISIPGNSDFLLSIAYTCLRMAAGLVSALVLAIIISYLMAKKEWIRIIMNPWIVTMRSVPVISFILLALIFLNSESIPLFISFLTMFPLLTENLYQGIKHIRPGYKTMGRVFHLSQTNYIAHIIYPQIQPYLFSGISSAAGFGWRAIIMGEVIAQCTNGIGGKMKEAQLFINTSELIAWTIIAIFLSWLTDKGVKSLSVWKPEIKFIKGTNPTINIPDFQLRNEIRLNNVSYYFGSDNMSFSLVKGHTYMLSAPSGAGKTTCLKLIDGTFKPAKGSIEGMPEYVSSVFQEQEILTHLTAKDNITLPLSSFYCKNKAMEIADKFLKAMEIEELAGRYPSELSYGQLQRVSLARALAYPAPLLLMDEPFRGLDKELLQRIIGIIKNLQNERGQTILFSSHNEEEADLMKAKIVIIRGQGNEGTRS